MAAWSVGWRAIRAAPGRRMASTFFQEMIEEESHALKTMVTWRNISLFGAIPAILITAYRAYKKEVEHHKHERDEFVGYEHLRRRIKPFPWGDGNHSLIHNPHTNPLPDGYEE